MATWKIALYRPDTSEWCSGINKDTGDFEWYWYVSIALLFDDYTDVQSAIEAAPQSYFIEPVWVTATGG